MKYMGSKARIAKHIFPIMDFFAKERGVSTWVEPFVGGGNMIEVVPDRFCRVGYDLNPHVIQAMVDIRDYPELLPGSVSEYEYAAMRGSPPSPFTSWVRFVCSFGGKFENGFARQNGADDSTFPGYGKRAAIKQSPKIQNIQFICDSYGNLDFENCLIYCDPPYAGTSGYKTGAFDHGKFFEWCRRQAKKNVVFVSEYNAPDDFIEVWAGEIKTSFASQRKAATHAAVEKLFLVIDSVANTK